MKRRCLSVAAAAMLGLSGCSGPSAHDAGVTTPTSDRGLVNPGTIVHAGHGKSYPRSTRLAMTIRPTNGPIGTVVHVEVTGCDDPTGVDHALSYNPVASRGLDTMQMSQDYPHALSPIATSIVSNRLEAAFTVVSAPAPSGEFTMQCGASLTSRAFTVTAAR